MMDNSYVAMEHPSQCPDNVSVHNCYSYSCFFSCCCCHQHCYMHHHCFVHIVSIDDAVAVVVIVVCVAAICHHHCRCLSLTAATAATTITTPAIHTVIYCYIIYLSVRSSHVEWRISHDVLSIDVNAIPYQEVAMHHVTIFGSLNQIRRAKTDKKIEHVLCTTCCYTAGELKKNMLYVEK